MCKLTISRPYLIFCGISIKDAIAIFLANIGFILLPENRKKKRGNLGLHSSNTIYQFTDLLE